MKRKLHGMVMILGAMAVVALMSTASQAGLCDTLFGWCGLCSKSQQQQVAYMPPVAPACGPCAPNVTYVPQTAYRTVYRRVPVTTYRPIAVTDACTGCATTALRPVVTYRRQPQLIPYRSYRLVYSNPVRSACNPCATCPSPCATGVCGSASSSGCTSCANGGPTPAQTYESNGATQEQFNIPAIESQRPVTAPTTPATESSTMELTPAFSAPLQGPSGRTTMRPTAYTKPVTDKYGWGTSY